MTTLTSNDPLSALAISTVSLRIVQPGADDRIVPLAIGKCTVGSSDHCQVQLTSVQVRPLHCLIVHETTGTSITRWAHGALLNDLEFTTAPFQPGDCLQIGDVQLSLFAEANASQVPPEKPEPPPTAAVNNAFAMPAPTELQQQLRVALEEREQIFTQLSQLQGEAAERESQSSEEIDRLISELSTAYDKASTAETTLAEQVKQAEQSQEELALVQTERDQLTVSQAETQQCQQEAEQARTDSEQNLAVFQLELEKFQITSRNTEQELIESHAALENLESKIAPLSEEREQLVTKRTEYQLREQGWEHELATRDTQIEQLSEEIEQLRAAVATANQGAADQVAQVGNFQQQLDTLTLQRDQLLAAQDEQVQLIQEWEKTVATRDHRIHELEEEHVSICEVLQSVEKGAFEQVDSCNKLEKQLASLRDQRDQLTGALPEQQEYIQQLEQAHVERDGQITLLSDELAKTSLRQTELETELAQGAAAYQALEATFAALRSRSHPLAAEQNTQDQKQEREPEPVPVANKPGVELETKQTGSDEDSDEALETYMSNMLLRMRGDANDEQSQPPQTSSTATLNQHPDPVAVVDQVLDRIAPEREVAKQAQDQEPFNLENLKQSSHKPVTPIDLSAMRELANSSARQAIAQHHKRHSLEKAFGLFLVCLIAIGIGSYMLLTATSAQEFLGFNFLGGAAVVLAGVGGVFKLLGLLLLMIREGAWKKKQPAASTNSKAQAPLPRLSP